MTEDRKLMTFEFLGLCFISGVTYCNIAVFYNLFDYLQTLGIPADLCGVLIGAYSLTAVALYLLVSPFINADNAPRTMWLGMIVLAVCGQSYFFIHSFWGLLGLRMLNGLGQFLMAAAGMALFIAVIPLSRSGQAFGLYSIAGLLPYGTVPAVMDALAAYIPTPPHGYAAVTFLLLPAAWIVQQVKKRCKNQEIPTEKPRLPNWRDICSNLMQGPVILLLFLNVGYSIGWSSLFFLFKKFADQKGLVNVGYFFTTQMGMMIILRLLGGRIFDALDKRKLVMVSAALVALGYMALDHLPGLWAFPLVALLFGVGMGSGSPALYGLMFELSPPRFRSVNANLMLCAVQLGFVFGPVLGVGVVARFGYHGFFMACAALAALTSALSAFLPVKENPAYPRQGKGHR